MNHTTFPELDLLKLFRGVCVAVEQLHFHKLTSVPSRRRTPNMEMEPLMDEEAAAAAAEEDDEQVEGEIVPYAHRDIKPGIPSPSSLPSPSTFLFPLPYPLSPLHSPLSL